MSDIDKHKHSYPIASDASKLAAKESGLEVRWHTLGGELVPFVPLDACREAAEQERQAVLNAINLFGDEILHDALDAIGWPANYIKGK